MKFLLDESCNATIADALEAAGYKVIRVSEMARGSTDEEVILLAHNQACILLTEDKDFGQLVYAAGQENTGVILFRFPTHEVEHIAKKIVELVATEGNALQKAFVVLENTKIRIRRKHE